MELAVAPGDHACGVFASDDDQAALVGRFARDAFARGDRLFYLADRSEEASVVAFLENAGFEGRKRLGSGELQVLHSSQMALEDGFERDRQMAVWDQLVAQARNDGYRGLSVAAEMSWALSWKVAPEAVIDYEATAGEVFASGHMAALCQYDTRLFEGPLIERAGHAHPYTLAVRGDEYKVRYRRLYLHRSADGIELGGEIDLSNVAYLEAELMPLLGGGDIVVDCSELRFVDVAGCRLLHRASGDEPGRGRVELRNTSPLLKRVLGLLSWVDG